METVIAETAFRTGHHVEAWEALDDIPADQRQLPPVLALRLLICAAMKRWELGLCIADALGWMPEDEYPMAAAEFHLAYARHLAEEEFRNVEARNEVARAELLWPDCLDNLPKGDICWALSYSEKE